MKSKIVPDVILLHHTPLWVAIHAIRKCWASEEQSDSYPADTSNDSRQQEFVLGERDKMLIRRIIKCGHHSTIEHIVYNFDIDNMSRAILQELARHRIASLSVQSTRYTIKRLLDSGDLDLLLIDTGDEDLNQLNRDHMMRVRGLARRKGIHKDTLKYGIPENYKTTLVWTINARSLRNFLTLRLSKRAHPEIRRLAQTVLSRIPEDHRILFEDIIQL